MQEIQYVGELLLPGQIGHIMVLLSVFTSVVAAFYFWLSASQGAGEKHKFLRIAQWVYGLHMIALILVGAAMYYLIFNHRFEYNYVWRYSSMDLQVRYIVACFWAGQEGSFWVWAFWQGLIGLVIAFGIKTWKAPLMLIVSISQFFLVSMLMGIHVFGFRIGSSPFVLLRHLPEYANETFFSNPNYVENIMDGLGLNPLLENPWMVTHPPVLFLGYALFLIPFAYALTGLWKKQYTAWIKPALPWVSSSLITLGAGILLGGRWAYESLTFGGFWAWDPVENASLVPWLVMVAALHLMLINIRRKQHYRASFIVTFLAFLFILYATFLTRSGILAETSVHSFGADKRYLQLIIYMAIFFLVPLFFLIKNWKKTPSTEGEELLSREFFLFAGSIVLILSSFQIIFATSIPVINAVLGTNMAPPSDPVTYFNNWQLPFAIMMLALIGLAQFLHYRKNRSAEYFKSLLFSILITIILTIIYSLLFHSRLLLTLLVSVSIFTVIASLDYLLRFIKKPQNIPASITHIGFGIFVAAIVLTFANEQTISFDPKTGSENMKLSRGKVTRLGDYYVVYSDRDRKVNETFYTLDFLNMRDDSVFFLDFSLHPSINRHPQMGQVSNPATRHTLTRDIYTYISHAQEVEKATEEGYTQIERAQMSLGDTMIAFRSFIILDSLHVEMENQSYEQMNIHARFTIKTMMAAPRKVWASYIVSGDSVRFEDAILEDFEARLRFEGVGQQPQTINLGVYARAEDHIVLRAIIFPYIRLLWFGAFIMLAGLVWVFIKRINQLRERKLST